MRLLVTSGLVVTPAGIQELDILCEGGRIAALVDPGVSLDADETVDATGKVVFPGFIDPHVHS
ncbi:MAG: dihydropyrimidinase, partial [Nocardioidaceae bacterium]